MAKKRQAARRHGVGTPPLPAPAECGTCNTPQQGLRPYWSWGMTALCLAGFALAAASAVYFGLFAASYFPDNCYNLAVALHSASAKSTHFLETSAAFLFFEQYPIPRAEDWHRGLSVIALKYWALLTGHHGERWMRVPHLLWVAFWIGCAVKLLTRANGGRTALWARALLVFALLVSPWAFTVLGNSYLDDIPSAGFVLAGLTVLAKRPASGKRVFAGGALFGLAFVTKDFSLVWLPILCASLVLASLLRPATDRFRNAATQVGLFCLGYAVICTPRVMWDVHDLGGILANPIQYWLKGWYFGSRDGCLSCFAPSYLLGDESYRSIVALSGGIAGVLRNIVERSALDTVKAFAWLGFAWVWLLACFFPADRTRGTQDEARFLRVVVFVAMAAYAVFFGVGKGEAIQLRYWTPLVTLALVTGVHGLVRAMDGPRMSWRRGIGIAVLVVAACLLQANPRSGDRAVYAAPFVSQPLADTVSSTVGEGESAILGLFPGFNYWRMKPEERVVIFWPECLKSLSDAQAEELFSYYRVRTACFYPDEALHERLRHWGFEERPSPDPYLSVLVRKKEYAEGK